MTGVFFVGDPFNRGTVKLGPLTVVPQPNGFVALQNQSGATINVGGYTIPANRYLNQQEVGDTIHNRNGFGILGIDGNGIGPWELWRINGATITAWNGETYAFGVIS